MNMRWFRNRAGEEKGAVLVVVSVAMVAMIGATALAVDIGRVTNNNRTLQARADVIVGGHQRVRAARELGYKIVPVVHVCLPPDEERLLNLALNRTPSGREEPPRRPSRAKAAQMAEPRAEAGKAARKTARTSFWTRYVSSFVQRDDVMAPMAPRPYVA